MSRSRRHKSRRSVRNGPIVLNEAVGRRREGVFGGAMPEGPLPGRLLVLLSRLHRAEAGPHAPKEQAPQT